MGEIYTKCSKLIFSPSVYVAQRFWHDLKLYTEQNNISVNDIPPSTVDEKGDLNIPVYTCQLGTTGLEYLHLPTFIKRLFDNSPYSIQKIRDLGDNIVYETDLDVIKVFTSQHQNTDEEKARARFYDEANLAYKLQRPTEYIQHLTPVFKKAFILQLVANHDPNTLLCSFYFYIMEKFDMDLFSYIENFSIDQVPEDLIWNRFNELGNLQVLCVDLKPDNILVTFAPDKKKISTLSLIDWASDWCLQKVETITTEEKLPPKEVSDILGLLMNLVFTINCYSIQQKNLKIKEPKIANKQKWAELLVSRNDVVIKQLNIMWCLFTTTDRIKKNIERYGETDDFISYTLTILSQLQLSNSKGRLSDLYYQIRILQEPTVQ